MTSSDSYYRRQAEARGLKTNADVEALTDLMSISYDRLLPNWLPASRTAAIYELACGPGVMLRYLKRKGYTNISGSDMSECQIALAKAASFPVKLSDSIQELKSHPDGTWDCLIAIDFIEHLPKDVLTDFLIQSHRVLKKGGLLILRGPNGDSPLVGRNLYNDITHFWAYTTVATRALLQIAGYSRIDFADESLASLQKQRWIKVPLMRFSQWLLRLIMRAATKEDVQYWSPSLYVFARKNID